MMWTLDDALLFIRQHQPLARECDYNLALGGGVLNNGESKKDLDIVCLPRSARRTPSPAPLIRAIFGPYQSPEEITDYEGGDGDDMSGRTVYRGHVGPDRIVDFIVVDFRAAAQVRNSL